jgi:hypothetical protein
MSVEVEQQSQIQTGRMLAANRLSGNDALIRRFLGIPYEDQRQ